MAVPKARDCLIPIQTLLNDKPKTPVCCPRLRFTVFKADRYRARHSFDAVSPMRHALPPSGGVNRHVYYRCTKSKDRHCKNPALNETELIEALLKMVDTISLDKVKLTVKLNSEIQKFKKLQAMFLGKKKTEKIEPIDLKDYAKFVLRDGTVLEQRSVLECVSSELTLKNGRISI